jgi:uncharacterized cupredoxin-like copper-binding protein
MRRVLAVLMLTALGAAGLVAGVLAGQGGAAATVPAAAKAITVKVVAKEFKFTLSRRSVPVGSTEICKVVNKGAATHEFKIAGKKTPLLKAGKSATIKVKFAKKGKFAYICTVLGHAKLGMKGVFAVGTKPVTTSTSTTTTSTTSTTTTTVTGPATTVQVGMFEYRFELSQATIPQGTVTFVITNKGQEVHNFNILGIKAGALLGPGQTETWTVGLPRNTYNVVCDVPFHVDRGMTTQLMVT